MNSARPPSVVNAEAADELLAGHRLPDAGLGQEQRKLEQPNWEQAQEQAPPLLPDAGANSRGTAGEAPGSAISTPLSPASPRPAQPRPSPQAARFTSGPSPLAAAAAVPPLVAPLPGAALPLQQGLTAAALAAHLPQSRPVTQRPQQARLPCQHTHKLLRCTCQAVLSAVKNIPHFATSGPFVLHCRARRTPAAASGAAPRRPCRRRICR